MVKSEVAIHLVNTRLCVFINGAQYKPKFKQPALPYLEESLGLVEFKERRGKTEPMDLTDGILAELEHCDRITNGLYSSDDFHVHFHNLKRKMIECIPIFKWMQENQNQVGKLCDGDIELIEMGDY